MSNGKIFSIKSTDERSVITAVFKCKNKETETRPEFLSFCTWLLEKLLEVDGIKENLDPEIGKEIISNFETLCTALEDKVLLEEFHVLSLDKHEDLYR